MTITYGPLHTLVLALSVIIFLMVSFALVRVINRKDNDLEWWHLVSTRTPDGKTWLDWDKIGKGVGVGLCIWLPVVYAYSDKMEAVGLAAVMGVALVYLGGVSAYSANLRSKQGAVETTRVIEEQPGPTRVTEKKVETPPIGDSQPQKEK